MMDRMTHIKKERQKDRKTERQKDRKQKTDKATYVRDSLLKTILRTLDLNNLVNPIF